MFVLVVSLQVKPDKDDQFLAAIEANAAASRRDDDEAAFQAHRQAPHFPVWRQVAANCLEGKGGQVNTATTLLFSSDLDRPAS